MIHSPFASDRDDETKLDSQVRSLFIVIIAAVAVLAFSACSTTAGLGRDVQNVGEKIEDKAQQHGG
jgi:predicted small secreted protein